MLTGPIDLRAGSLRERPANRLDALETRFPPARVTGEQLRDLQTQADDLQTLLGDLEVGLVVLDHRLVIRRVRGPVMIWLRQFFRTASNVLLLPEALEQWLREQIEGATTVRARCYESEDRQLWVQLAAARRAGEFHLLMRERARPGSRKSLEQLGLTEREAEVLSWLAQGKSNPEIGRILGIASRTVHKHLEHIYAHLGVENRTAAVARALEAM